MIDEGQSVLDIIKDYWGIMAGFAAFFVGYIEMRIQVLSTARRVDKIETTMRDDIHRVEDKIDANHRELMGYFQGLGR